MALATVGAPLIGSLFNKGPKDNSMAMLHRQDVAKNQQILEQRQKDYGQLGENIAQRNWHDRSAAKNLRFQKDAAMFGAGPLAERQNASNIDAFKRRTAFELSPEYQRLAGINQRRSDDSANLRATWAQDQMFGPTARTAGLFANRGFR